MAASGTTKKITSNQILGAGGTATLASATITGDLTVATSVLKVDSANTRVGINTTTINGGPFNVKISSAIDAKFVVQDGFTTGNVRLAAVDNAYTTYKIMDYSALSHAWYNSGSTAMTLNSTGLGVGAGPGLTGSSRRALTVNAPTGQLSILELAVNSVTTGYLFSNATQTSLVSQGATFLTFDTNSNERMRIDSSGNVGVGVTPSAWSSTWKAIQVGAIGSLSYSPDDTGYTISTSNGYWNGSNWIRIAAAAVSAYSQNQGKHSWLSAASSSAGSTIAFGDAKMTLDASGNLILLSSNTPATLTTNGQLTVNATSDTNLRFSYRGSDGVTRTANLTLAP
jgi:hypothetical protein